MTFWGRAFQVGAVVLFVAAVLQLLTGEHAADLATPGRAGPYLLGMFLPSVGCFLLGRWLSGKANAPVSVIPLTEVESPPQLTPAAAQLARCVIHARNYPSDSALRLADADGGEPALKLQYDVLTDEPDDCVTVSQGFAVVFHTALAAKVKGIVVDAVDGDYVFRRSS